MHAPSRGRGRGGGGRGGRGRATGDAPRVRSFAPPRFAVDDPAGYAYLEQHGYAVFKDVVPSDQLDEGRKLAWDFLEGMSTASIKRTDPRSWDQGWPDPYGKGIIVSEGVGQSPFLWFNRALPGVQHIYSTIWQTPDLATSFDGFCMFRPFEYNEKWLTKTGWYHLDQNGKVKPHKVCIQGFVNYYPSGEHDGGLVIVPGSHTVFNEIFTNHPQLGNSSRDFIKLEKFGPDSPWQNEIKRAGLSPIKVCAEAGDMVLWDSRIIHCNEPPTTARPIPADGSILPPRRLVAYVCMTPLARLTPDIIGKRQEAFRAGHTSSHWPEEIMIAGRTNASSWRFKPPKLAPGTSRLIPLYTEEEEGEDDHADETTTGERQQSDDRGEEEEEVQPARPATNNNNKRGGRNKRVAPGRPGR